MTATEGPTKGLELPDREELKGLEGAELEKSAMAGGSEGRGDAKRSQRGYGLGWAGSGGAKEAAAPRRVLGLGSVLG
jgi:hypothetical protein